MAKAIINPKKLIGEIRAVSSKSYAHRIYIAAALAAEDTEVICSDISDDISATLDCLKTITDESAQATPVVESVLIHCRESGSTLRFLLPVAAALLDSSKNFKFTGSEKLSNRPIAELMKVLSWKSVKFSSEKLPFAITGKLHSGDFKIPGNISSQYTSGLLMALPLLKGDSRIILDDKQQSVSYIEITRDVLERFNVFSERTDYGYYIKGGQNYKSPGKITVEGDWSNSAFYLAANVLGSNIKVNNLNADSKQGDKKIIEILKKRPMLIDLSDIPDLFPILAVVAAISENKTEFIHTERLRLKESDRLESTKAMLINLGFKPDAFEIYENSVTIYGKGSLLRGGTINSFNDHRIAMAGAIAATCCRETVVIEDYEAVNKSYPRFFEDYKCLGGDIIVNL